MKKILQTFIVMFVVMTGLSFLINGQVVNALLLGLGFALFMSVVLGFFHTSTGGHDTVQEGLWDVPLSYEEALHQCEQAGLHLKKAEVQEVRKRDGIIKVHTGASWKSWGDEIVFQLQEIDPATTRIAVTSRPKLKVTLMDYGKNHENIRSIEKHLKRGA
ncbi:hypothetical protein [Salimicrobium flavidum]|uniref:Uncharacterized protein n=1 Tax=Salimicrobium flavidum TaxID=570947 RepID=A0A1N7J824_9BACI|nr:hypothetical protein [Salimicrobium flavidum]SIS45386.1 hypothetical protein SAMN05421687_10498 [Salimicrobium flavidum]